MWKRAFLSIRSRWRRALLYVAAYTLLFALCFGVLVLLTTVKGQQEFLQGALDRSVTLRGMLYLVRAGMSSPGSISGSVPEDVFQTFTQDEAVEGSNSCTFWGMRIKDCTILYEEERRRSREEHHDGQTVFVRADGMMGLFVEDSVRSWAFLLNGLELVEGRHFAGEDAGNVCLISQQFAELNGLSVGDTVTATNCTDDIQGLSFSAELEVAGIFTCPDSGVLMKGIGARAEEMVIVPMGLFRTVRGREPHPRYVTAYLKEGADMDAFLRRMQESMPVYAVYDDHYTKGVGEVPPEECIGKDFDEIYEYAEQHPMYILQKDREWYGMVSEPIGQEVKLAEAMAALLLCSVVLILALTTALGMKERRREIGILLSMGETKPKIIGQLAVETLAPVIAALILGLGLGMTAGVPLAENLCNGVYAQKAVDVQKDNEAVTFGHLQETEFSYDINERLLALDLADGRVVDVQVYPKAKARADAGAAAGYVCALLAVALLATAGQGLSVMRAKPAEILLGRR